MIPMSIGQANYDNYEMLSHCNGVISHNYEILNHSYEAVS